MPMDHNSSGRRPHYHRGRRGMDRRGNERRTQPAEQASSRPSGDQTDVEQIMREIRSRISQRGIDLSPQQIQDLAARRLEAILDPRTMNPTLFDQLRKGAAVPPEPAARSADAEYTITDDAIYEGGGALRFFRRLFSPLRKMLFDPAPLISALQAQVRINRDAAARAAELERRQTEWNALHYQILQRLVTEVSRSSIEVQSLTTRIESLAARVDFNDRRVRALETTPAPPARSPRPQEAAAPVAAVTTAPSQMPATEAAPATAAPASAGDAPRRRRRRRRGRRGASQPGPLDATGIAGAAAAGLTTPEDGVDLEDGDEEEGPDGPEDSDVTPAISIAATPALPLEQETSSEPPPQAEPPALLIPESVEPPIAPEPVAALPDEPTVQPEPTTAPDPLRPASFAPPDPGASER